MSKKDKKKVKIVCPYCGRRTEAIQDIFFEDVFFCEKCGEEIHDSEI